MSSIQGKISVLSVEEVLDVEADQLLRKKLKPARTDVEIREISEKSVATLGYRAHSYITQSRSSVTVRTYRHGKNGQKSSIIPPTYLFNGFGGQ